MSNATDEKHPEFAHEPQEPPTSPPTTTASERGGSGGGDKEKSTTKSSLSVAYISARLTSLGTVEFYGLSTLRSWLPVNVGAGIVRDIRARMPGIIEFS